jgi:hypothetical protein
MAKPELLVLLGSGATLPAVPGVGQLTDELLRWRDYLEPTEAGSLLPADRAGDVSRQPLLKFIDSHLPPAEAPYNFEQHVGCLESLSHALGAGARAVGTWGDSPQLTSPVAPFVKPSTALTEHSQMSRAREAVCYWVLARVSAACDAVQQAARPHALTTGLKALAKHFRLRIVSLNYDDVPEHGSLRLETGYQRQYDGFVPEVVYEPADTHLHLQLHGSVLFGPDLRGQAVLPRYQDRAEARATWEPGRAVGVGPDGLEQLALPMITGFRKADQVLWEPFGTYMGAFRLFAHRIPTWLIIGYGGTDPHVNAVLQSAMMHRVFNPWWDATPLRAFVVDFHPMQAQVPLVLDVADPVGRLIISRLAATWASSDFPAPESYEFLRAGKMLSPRRFDRITKRLWLSLDGTAFAFGKGLPALITALNEPSDDRRPGVGEGVQAPSPRAPVRGLARLRAGLVNRRK